MDYINKNRANRLLMSCSRNTGTQDDAKLTKKMKTAKNTPAIERLFI